MVLKFSIAQLQAISNRAVAAWRGNHLVVRCAGGLPPSGRDQRAPGTYMYKEFDNMLPTANLAYHKLKYWPTTKLIKGTLTQCECNANHKYQGFTHLGTLEPGLGPTNCWFYAGVKSLTAVAD